MTNENNSKLHRHSFWTGLGFKDRTNSRKNSSLTLAAYPNQQIYKSPSNLTAPIQKSTFNGSSRVIAMVGNIRTGIGRMILEQLVSQKFIVVALIEKPDSQFNKSVQVLASSPSLFHAFVVESGLFNHQVKLSDDPPLIKLNPIDHTSNNLNLSTKRSSRSLVFRSFRLGHNKLKNSKLSPHLSTTTTGSSTLGDSTTEISSYGSVHSNNHNHHHSGLQDSSHHRTILELKNIFQAYRVDTVISSFEPQTLESPNGPRSKARLEDEKQFHLPPHAERARIERMERIVLEACIESKSVNRFAVTVHSTSLAPSVLSPNPTNKIRPHLLSVLSDALKITPSPPTIHITEFRWGFLMNDLAFDESLADGATAENGLGKWLCEPPKSRCIIDLSHKRCMIPVRTSSPKESTKKGKQRLEPVCMTLAEDVARFIGLACKLKEPWEWKTGRIVGDCIPGGWEETVETIEKISKSRFDREYVCLNTLTNGHTSDSGSSNSSLYQHKLPSNSDSIELNPNSQPSRPSIEDSFKFEDQLRTNLAKENQDASSVRMKEFIRVWYTPLPQPPRINIDGNRLRSKSHRNSTCAIAPRGSFKPQVGENGTLREPTLKATTINNGNNIQKPNHKFLSVPSSPPSANNSIGQAITTNSPSLPSNSLLARPKINQSSSLNQNSSKEFNFVPKVIVPFNTHQQQGSPFPNQKSNDQFNNTNNPHTTLNEHQQQQSFDRVLNPSLESPPTIPPFIHVNHNQSDSFFSSPNHHHHHHQNHTFINQTHSLSPTSRDDHRIFRKSPLATRVA